MNIKGVIFDLDGTLLDSIKTISDSMNFILSSYGFSKHSISDYKSFVGEGVDILIKRSLPPNHLYSVQEFDTILSQYKSRYDDIWEIDTKPYPEVREILSWLNRTKIKIAVLSNKSDPITRHQVLTLFKEIKFDFVFGAREGVANKPDPTVANMIAEKMGYRSGEMLFVGDSDIDMQTATNAGMIPVGVAWGFRSKDELIRNGAAKVLSRMGEIKEFFLKSDNL